MTTFEKRTVGVPQGIELERGALRELGEEFLVSVELVERKKERKGVERKRGKGGGEEGEEEEEGEGERVTFSVVLGEIEMAKLLSLEKEYLWDQVCGGGDFFFFFFSF